MSSAGPSIGEQRVPMQLQVTIRGMTATGKPFSQLVSTVEISRAGAKLTGITCPILVGEVVIVQHGQNKCRCQVTWTGQIGSADEGELAVKCLNPSECPWSMYVPSGAETANPPADTTNPSWPQCDRRKFPRIPCTGVVRMSRRGDHLATAAKLVDISIGGCYAESMSPWPVGTEVELTLVVGSNEIVVAGIVRTCHAIMGNGIEFTAVTDETRNSVEQLISSLATTPSLPDQPDYGRALSLEAKVEAILQLLERKKVMTRDEVLTELKKLDPRKLANSWSNSDTK